MKKTPEDKIRLNAFYGAQGFPINGTGHSLTGVSEPLYYNDSIHIIYDACRSCYAIKDDNKSYDEIKTYIGKRVQAGHDSIVEHSNIIIAVHGTLDDYMPDLLRLTTNKRNLCKYLKIASDAGDPNREGNTFNTIFQGSIRGFKHLLKAFPVFRLCGLAGDYVACALHLFELIFGELLAGLAALVHKFLVHILGAVGRCVGCHFDGLDGGIDV